MATALKVLGQSAPSATTLTTLYTVSSGTTAVASSIVVCNRDSSPTTFRVAVRVGSAVITNSQYLYYDVPISGNNTFIATIGITLGAGDIVSVYAGAAILSFNLFGQENT